MNKFLLLCQFLVLFSISNLSAQQHHAICGADGLHEENYQNNPFYKENYDRTKAFLAKQGIKNYKTVTVGATTEYHIPVVVHVLHTGGAVGSNYNPSVATINALVAQINNGFANTYNHSSTVGTFNSIDIPIRFYLAQRTDACVTSTGINRINMSTNATYVASGVSRGGTNPGITDATLKATDHWNDLNYYNIYIVNKINGEDGYTTTGSYVAGYANYPVLGGYDRDGMVCLAYSASQATSTVFIHEMGHGFNLAHTFEGGGTTTCPSNTNCTTQNDEVCDTEPMQQSFTCNPTGNNPCTGIAYAGAQWNYMSYNGCTDRYTNGQKTRVMAVINDVRTSYKNSAGIDPPPAALPIAIAGPAYTSANNGNNSNMGPRVVRLNAIEHTSHGYTFEGAGDQHYIDNTCNQSTTLIIGTSYPLSVETQLNNQDCSVYIDYNNDGIFHPTNERVLNSTGTTSNQTHTATVIAPATAVQGVPLRMRVIADFASATISPTATLLYGQAEDYTVTVLTSPLPVLWRSISAKLNFRQNVDVRWTTEMEYNSASFEIEKSKDGVNFYKIGTSKAAGMSELPAYYNFEDVKNVNGYNYYRVKHIDEDGQMSYSSIVSVIIESEVTDITIFPNPTRDALFISIVGMNQNTNSVKYSITDLNGREWIKNEIKVTKKDIQLSENMESLPAGMYFIQLSINGNLTTQKIVKQ